MKQSGLVSATAFAFFSGMSFLIAKLVLPLAEPSLILAHRYLVAMIGYLLFLGLTKKSIQISFMQIVTIFPITLLYPLLFFLLQLYGLSYAGSSEAGIIFALVPVLTILISMILGTRVSFLQFASILLSVGGAIYMIYRNAESAKNSTVGLILLFLSTLSFALYTVIIKDLLKKVSIYELTLVVSISGFVLFNLLFIIQTDNPPLLLSRYFLPFRSPEYLLGIVYLGFCASILTSLFSNYALKHLSASQFSVFSNLATLISVIVGAWFLGEHLHSYHYIGGAFILSGVVGVNLTTKKSQRTVY